MPDALLLLPRAALAVDEGDGDERIGLHRGAAAGSVERGAGLIHAAADGDGALVPGAPERDLAGRDQPWLASNGEPAGTQPASACGPFGSTAAARACRYCSAAACAAAGARRCSAAAGAAAPSTRMSMAILRLPERTNVSSTSSFSLRLLCSDAERQGRPQEPWCRPERKKEGGGPPGVSVGAGARADKSDDRGCGLTIREHRWSASAQARLLRPAPPRARERPGNDRRSRRSPGARDSRRIASARGNAERVSPAARRGSERTDRRRGTGAAKHGAAAVPLPNEERGGERR